LLNAKPGYVQAPDQRALSLVADTELAGRLRPRPGITAMRIVAVLGFLAIAPLSLTAEAKQQDPTCILRIFRSNVFFLDKATETTIGDLMRQAESGDKSAQITLAMHYAEGTWVPKDLNKAIEWAGRAAPSAGPAKEELVRFLSLMHADATTPSDGFTIFRRGAESDVLFFQYAYAEVLRSQGNLHEAARFYERAAANGCMDARTKLSDLYDAQTPPDRVRAYMWISLADYATNPLTQLLKELKENLEYDETRVRAVQAQLRRKMTPAEIEEAEKLATRWTEQHAE
jgi:TPR repeat protein